MKATELRIGNLFMDKLTGALLLVDDLTTDRSTDQIKHTEGFYVVDRSKYPLPEGWQAIPIPLTDGWLVRLGFDGIDFKRTIHPKSGIKDIDIVFENRHDGWSYQLGYSREWLPAIGIEYVHQLQNLYFALTGEELEISDRPQREPEEPRRL